MSQAEFMSILDRAYAQGWEYQGKVEGTSLEAARACPYRGRAATQWLNGWHAARAREECR